ncbi:MAG TPA: methyltransferase domain-containing protein, partial [Bryobacteraceae bacterium]|nr:methyltransferase domain-containing protein [Bryobacteraceae bacterium]
MTPAPALSHPDAEFHFETLANGRRRLRIEPKRPIFVSRSTVETSYPDELIAAIVATKAAGSVCDEIARDEDPAYVESTLRRDIFALFSEPELRGRRILDVGCGSGASTAILHRMLPDAEIWGVELDESLLRIARLRALHHGFSPERLMLAPHGNTLPSGLGPFDFVS